jgi:hypothetical protein
LPITFWLQDHSVAIIATVSRRVDEDHASVSNIAESLPALIAALGEELSSADAGKAKTAWIGE